VMPDSKHEADGGLPGLVVVCGPTASGKTALGLALAERLGGEVVSADAFAVYRGLDIGTAKPTEAERARVPHHLVDVADPRERYSAGQFLRDADGAIADITARGRVPVVVGGTHFYVRALLQGLFPEPPKDPDLRRRLEEEWDADRSATRARLAVLDPQAAARIAAEDRQRTLRALEVSLLSGRAMSDLWREHARAPRYRFLLLGLGPSRAELHARIASRVARMFAVGLIAEVLGLVASGVPSQAHAFKAIGYRESIRAIQGLDTAEGAEADTVVATRQLAKRQVTWLRGESDVEWLGGTGEQLVMQAIGLVEVWRGLEHGAAQGQ
jgi:tRNA dimethylallyltransferase